MLFIIFRHCLRFYGILFTAYSNTINEIREKNGTAHKFIHFETLITCIKSKTTHLNGNYYQQQQQQRQQKRKECTKSENKKLFF